MKSSIAFLLSFAVILAAGTQIAVYDAGANAEEITSQITSAGAIVIDFETGDEIYAHNADTPRDPASMTKMLTVYLVYQAIADGQIDLDTVVPISGYVEEFARNPNETNVPLSQHGVYTVDELLDAVIVVSAGGAAIALAELVGGTRRGFIRMMNEKAAEWGVDAHFESISGGGEMTYMTPRAMATITRNTIIQFPLILERTSLPSLKFGWWTYQSTNHLLGVYEGIDGYKTGTNSYAKENFAATAGRGDIRIISVTMGSNYSKRFDDTTILLDYGFAVMERRLEAERLEKERLEEEARLEAARLEEARIEEEARLEAERLEKERLEEEARLEATKLEEETRLEAEKLEEERKNAEKARTDKVVAIIVYSFLGCSVVGIGMLACVKDKHE